MFSRLSLRYRIALVIFLLEAAMLAGVLGVTLTQSRQTASDFNTASQKASLDLLSNLSITALLTSEYSDYQLYIQDVQKQPSLQRIVLTDQTGRVVAGSRVTDVGRELAEAVKKNEAGWRVQPVNTPAGPLGTLAVQFSDAALTAAQAKTRNLAVAIAVSGMLIVALVGLATGFALTRRLEVVTEAARRFAEGDHAARSRIAGGDEVALLSRSFDRMADAVARQQQQLQEQGAHVRLLLDSTAEAIYGADAAGICTFVNPACLRMLGYAHEDELIGKSIHEMIHHTRPDGRPYPKEECRVRLASLAGQAAHTDDELHWRKDGTALPVEWWSHPLYRDGTLIGTVVTFIDITERKRADEELRQFKTTLDLTQDCVFMFDPVTLRFFYVNQGATRQVGYSAGELMQMTPVDIKPDFDEAAFREVLAPMLAGTTQSISFETRHRHKDGHDIAVEIFLQYIAPHGEPPRFVAVVRDISERRRTEEALRRLNEELEARVEQRTVQLLVAKEDAERANLAKSEFLSRMSHELRTPLNAILGFGQVLESDPQHPLADEQQENVQEILHAGAHLLELINEVLDLARIESGKLTVSKEPVHLATLLPECLTLIRPLAQQRGIDLMEPGQDCDSHVRADRMRLKQVLINLLSNAVKYNRPQGSVSIACVVSGDAVRIRVTDSGAGLTPEQQSRLFTAFERFDADARAIEGTGIGLALSKRLVELMDGAIGVQSMPGVGSTFWVRLPLATAETEESGASHAVPAPVVAGAAVPARADVLCIEDNPANLRLIERLLGRRADVRLFSAGTPSLGLELARAHRPALILLDINLPEMDGFEVMKCLQESDATRGITVVAISANASPADVERGRAAGFADYLTKPLDVQKFMQAVDDLLAQVRTGWPAHS